MFIGSHSRLLCTTAIIGFLVMPSYAHAGPEGGAVTSGSAGIHKAGNSTTINQSSDRAIIRWDSFDLNSSESVHFNQPNAGSITVNRIRDVKASQIDGHIGANGKIVLINPNGVVFGATATVDVGSLVATTSDLADDNEFMNGGAVRFTKPGLPNAKVVNEGSITVREGGLVGLVAPNVENHGIIQARLGKVALASGDIATIDFAGDGLIKLEVTDAVLSQRVLNTGTIKADGGEILLTAAQARGMVDALVTNTGTLQARTITTGGVQKTGSVTLSTKGLPHGFNLSIPRAEGEIFTTGRIDVDGLSANEKGGDVIMVADRIAVGDGSYITASGDTDGGTIKIGGEYQGGPGLPTSDMVFISEHVILNANSRRAGKGGKIIFWSDTNTRFYGHADVSGITDGGFIEISGKENLDFNGTVDLSTVSGSKGLLLLDPTDITISNAANNNMNGASPFAPVADDGATVLNATTLLNALASGNVIVQTRATGSQAGNITVNAALSWGNSNTLTLDAHNQIIVNQNITGQNLRFIAGGDVQLNANLSGTGTLTIQQAADTGTVGIGASAVGTLNLNASDLTRIIDGWNEIVIGKSTATVGMDVRATTFADNLRLLSGTGTITVNGTLNMGANNLAIVTDGDIALAATNSLTGTGNLSISQASANTGMGIGASQTGAVNLTNTEVGRITNGWNSITLGRTDGSGILNFNTLTWNDHLTVQSGSGVININGVQTMAAGNNMSILTDADINLAVANALTGSSTGNLSITQVSANTSMGFGDTQVGTINLNTAEVGRIANSWNTITFGRTDGSADINIGGLTWNDHVTFQTGSGVIRVNGNQISNAANMSFVSDADMLLNGSFTVSAGTVNITFAQASAGTSMGIGDGQGGTLSFSNADLDQIVNGWNAILFGRTDGTQNMNVGARTWNDTVGFQTGTGVISILGTQTMNAAGMTIRTDANVNIGADLVGSAAAFTLTQSSTGVSMGIGTGEAGTVHLDDTEVGHILNGWSVINFGRTDSSADLNISANSWDDPLALRNGTGVTYINGTQSMVANNLSITTDADIVLTGNLTGTGSVSILNSTAGASMGLGDGQTGSINLTTAEMGRITNGWSYIYLGNTTMNGDMNIGALTWNDRAQFRTLNGSINFNGAQNFAGNAVTITANALAINATMTGTSTIAIAATTASNTIGLGAGQTGVLNIDATEMDYLSNTFSSITIGSTSHTGAVNIGAMTLKDPLIVRNTSGIMTINGDVNMGANNLTLSSNNNMAINARLIGTGTLSIAGSSSNVSVGIGTGQAGTLSLVESELVYLDNGWANVVFAATGSGVFNIAGRTWNHSIDIRSTSGALNINGVQNMGTNNLTIRTNTNLTIGQNLVGSGILTITNTTAATTIGVGDSQAGTLHLSNAELNYIVDGWNLLVFGSTAVTGAMNVGARTWTDSVDFRTTTGVININGAQNVGSNNLTIRSDANPVIGAALTGTGTLSLIPVTAATTVAVGGGAGAFSINDAELNQITNGWSNIVIGSNTSTGAMSVTTRTWQDNLTLNTSTGVINVSGAQNMGANNLTFITSGNPVIGAALNGTGTLTFQQNATNTTLALGTGQSGTLNLDNTELGNLTNGWSNIVFGRTDGTGTVAVGAWTWNDNLTLRAGTGVMTIAGNQTMGANNLTLMTNSNLALSGNLTGTGQLTIMGSSNATTMGIGDSQTGTLNLTNAELARLINGWAGITIGNVDNAGVINIGGYTWLDPITFVTRGNVVLNGVQNTTETSGTTMVFATINGAFINNAGASAINPGGSGRYLVYSVDEANDTLGGITRPGILTNKTYAGYGPGSVVESGSQHLYSGLVSKTLFLTIDDVDKFYGDSNPGFTYTYVSGLVNGDTLNDAILSYTMNALGSSVFDSAGTTRTVTGNFTMQNGYSVVVTNGTMTVIKATITVEADPTSRTYGSANPTFNVSYDGFKNGEDETDLSVLATASSMANNVSNVGSYVITASGASASNYDFVYVDGTLSVTKATLTATVQNASREYGDTNPTFNIVYTGFKNGETAAVIDAVATASSVGTGANVGTYTITGSGGVDNNYIFSFVNGTLTINKATVLATANNASRTYGDSNPAFGVTYTGFKNGETSAVIDTLATASSAANSTSGVGTYTISASGAADNNYNITYATGTLTVNKATLTATAGNASREYGDSNPAIGVSYSGFKNGETASVINVGATGSSTANNTSGVGTYATTASGASDDNYDFSYVNGTLTVTKAMLTATAGNASREYGDSNPAIGVTYTGFKNGETASVINVGATGSSTASNTSGVGTYATTAGGASDDNYDFTYANGTLTVSKAMLTATANDASRVYGDSNPSIGVSYSGFKNGETASVINVGATGSSTANNTSGVGTYSTTATGASDDNYDFTYVDGTLTVNKATLTATAGNASREYGDSNPAIGVTYTGFKNGETDSVINVGATASSAADALSNVGSYTTTASGASDDNYDFSYANGTLTVTKAMLTATADNVSRAYGENTNPAIGVIYTGFKNGETSAVINTLATGVSAANALSDVGTYDTTASGAVDNNYNFTYVNGTLTVTKAMLTATAASVSRTYGDSNPSIGVTYTGFKNGQNASIIDTQATASSAANNFSNVGTYDTVASGASDSNYDFTYVDGILTINKAILTATADNSTREYGESNLPIGVTYTGFKNSETDSVIDTLATASSIADEYSNVGNYNTVASGASDGNYSFTYVNGTLSVTKATLLVTANDTSRTYGSNNPGFTATYTGFKNGQTTSVINTLASGTTSATATSDVGTYGITMSGASDNNYNFTYAGGTLTINKATLVARADDVSRKQGQPNPALTVTYTGFKNGENASVINTLATASTAVNTSTPIGTYAITSSGALDNNYTFSYVDGVFTVLDPDYVPPPPQQLPSTASQILPPTATNPMPQTQVPVFQNTAFYSNNLQQMTQGYVIVAEENDFEYLWQRDNFLIAMTNSLQNYYVIDGGLRGHFSSSEERP